MPRVSDIFGGAYLKAEQWGLGRDVKIDGYNVEKIYGEEAYVVYLVGEKRGFKLSQTCANDIAAVLGDEMASWPGGEIELYTERRTITDRETKEEKLVTMFRARAPRGNVGKLAPPGTPPPQSDPDDVDPLLIGRGHDQRNASAAARA